MGKHKNYDNLFIDILEIGMKSINTGISYTDLIIELENKNYRFDDTSNFCRETTIKRWIRGYFIPCDCLGEHLENCGCSEENDDILFENCKWVISGYAGLTYLDYINTKESKIACSKAVTVAIVVAVVSTILSLVGILLQCLR